MMTGTEILGVCLGSSGLFAVVLAVLQHYWQKHDRADSAVEEVKKLTLALARDRIIGLCKACISEGRVSNSEAEEIQAIFEPYKEAGGDGLADSYMEAISRLPRGD